MSESLGTFKGPALALAIGGLLAMVIPWRRGRSPVSMFRLGWKYLFVCGGLFVAYTLLIYTSLGLAPDRPTAIMAGLLNYLWPPLIVVSSVPILKKRVRWRWLVPGVMLAFAGSAVAVLGHAGFGPAAFREIGADAWVPLSLAAIAGVCWALYSNFARRLGPGSESGGAVPLFLLIAAAGLALCGLTRDETLNWSPSAAFEFAVIVLVCTFAYPLWESGMRDGNRTVIDRACLGLPILATALASLWLWVLPGPSFVLGCLLVVTGACVCDLGSKRSAYGVDPGSQGPARPMAAKLPSWRLCGAAANRP